MEFIISIVIGLLILFVSLKVLTGMLKFFGIIGALIVAAVLYFSMGGASL